MKNRNNLNVNRTCDLPACRTVPQANVPPRTSQVVKVKEMLLSPFILLHTKERFSNTYSQIQTTISIKNIWKELALYT